MPLEIIKLLFGIGGGALLGVVITYFGTRHTAAITLQIAREKLETENRLQNAATTTIKKLLLEPAWELRSFDTIRKHIRGFKDDELRKLIVASGGVAFEELETGQELWGLPERNSARLRPTGDLSAFNVTLAAASIGDATRSMAPLQIGPAARNDGPRPPLDTPPISPPETDSSGG